MIDEPTKAALKQFGGCRVSMKVLGHTGRMRRFRHDLASGVGWNDMTSPVRWICSLLIASPALVVLASSASAESRQHVIITLNLPYGAPDSPAAIAAAQDMLTADIRGSDLRVVTRYKREPRIAAIATPRALRALYRHPGVRSVQPDVMTRR